MAEIESVCHRCVEFDGWPGRHGGKNRMRKGHVVATGKDPRSGARDTKLLKKSTAHLKARPEGGGQGNKLSLRVPSPPTNREAWSCQTRILCDVGGVGIADQHALILRFQGEVAPAFASLWFLNPSRVRSCPGWVWPAAHQHPTRMTALPPLRRHPSLNSGPDPDDWGFFPSSYLE